MNWFQLSYLSAVLVFLLPDFVLAHVVPGLDSLDVQVSIAKRASNLIDPVYNDLSAPEIDFINSHLKNLTNATGSACTKCKNRIKYGKTLIEDYPDKTHLVSLLLFKHCLIQNNGTESKCDNTDFFVTTDSKNFEKFNQDYDSGVASGVSVNFFDNDFIQLLKNVNVSSDLDLEYYCYYKGNSACDLPETKDVDEFYGIQSWWPEKQPHHYFEPEYKNNTEKFNVLHITDFHIQLRYTLGAEANCTSTPCALPESYNKELPGPSYNFTDYYKTFNPNVSIDRLSFYPDAHYDENSTYIKGEYYDFPKYRGWNFKNAPASTFGGYLSDSPEVLMNSSLIEVAKAHKEKNFEFVVFTGDMVDHDVIHCSPAVTKEAEVRSFSLFKHYLNDIPVLPSLGNHDTFPYGQISPLQYDFNNSYHWNEELMADLWINNGWFDEEDRNELKSHYAGFSYVTDRGLKVIGLNSNCYYQKNLWSYIDISTNPDLFGQWEFLVNELLESESKGQRVWIMAHIPTADADALPLQSRIFGKIVERFSPYTIANIFWGHTHQDQFHILYSSNSSQTADDIVNMAWVAQSVTPLPNYNPSWKYYEVENESFNIINSYNYYTHLNDTFTNGGDEPEWIFEYSVRDLYDSNHTWPEEAPLNGTFWHNHVLTKLKDQSNVEFNQLFADIMFRYGPGAPKCKTNGTQISDKCHDENYCVMGNFYSDDYIKCLKGKAN
ncbi:hypothetical protein KGF57_000555 [Candida theae]|uniref:Calcineurin-like phosphoesterase domain-containing protein n=1 Tax=Candida theae TaxID=1198502 RepID=A0AAD5BIW6_9ASCO|nr:uncharacterized protein KGF57_000555 [Candida theae]KAI5967126.1 hypothetical protein KGF57_000555 [Candida theae]